MPVQTRKRKAREADLAPVPNPPAKKKQQSQATTKDEDEQPKPMVASTGGDQGASSIALPSAYDHFTVEGDKGKDIPCQVWPSSSISQTASQSARGTTLIFTHGAGGGLSNPATRLFAEGYVGATAKDHHASCVLFQGSMNLQSRVTSFDSVLSHLKAGTPNQTFAVGGRSMGARAAVMVATAHKEIRKVVCVSYPLASPKGEIRDQILLDLPAEKEVLFVSGSADSMCDVVELGKVMTKMKAKSTLVVVEDADHGMDMMYLARHGVKGEKKEDVISRVKSETGRIAAKWVIDSNSVVSGWKIDYDAAKDEIITGPRAEEAYAHRVEGNMNGGKGEAVEGQEDATRKTHRRKRGRKQDGKDRNGEVTNTDQAVETSEHEEVASSGKHISDAGAETVVNSVKHNVDAGMNVLPWLEKVGIQRETWEDTEASLNIREECSGEAPNEGSADDQIDGQY